MASKASLVAFVVEQLGRNVTAKKIADERWDDAAFMAELARVSAKELAARPAKRKPAKPRAKAKVIAKPARAKKRGA